MEQQPSVLSNVLDILSHRLEIRIATHLSLNKEEFNEVYRAVFGLNTLAYITTGREYESTLNNQGDYLPFIVNDIIEFQSLWVTELLSRPNGAEQMSVLRNAIAANLTSIKESTFMPSEITERIDVSFVDDNDRLTIYLMSLAFKAIIEDTSIKLKDNHNGQGKAARSS